MPTSTAPGPQVFGGDGGAPAPPGAPSTTAVCRTGATSDPALEPIDDFEDGTRELMPVGDRTGRWSGNHDQTVGGLQVPEPFAVSEIAGCANSRYGHLRGKGFNDWGAHLTFNFKAGKTPYDVGAAYSGLSFWARSTRGTKIRVNLPNQDTDPAGKLCDTTPGKNASLGCHNHFGQDITLSSTWTRYTVTWSAVRQQAGWGRQVDAYDAANAYGVTFAIPAKVTYDLWIDDVAFIKK
jgi:hypothetical protein